MKGLPVEIREKDTVKFPRCSINRLSLTLFLRINFEYIAKLKHLFLFCNGDTLILLRGRNSVLMYLIQKIRAPIN
jgi:hypothetical protein